MARTQTIIEAITCDICGKAVDEATIVVLGWDSDRWKVDLCAKDYERVSTQFDKWIANGRSASSASRGGRKRPASRRAPSNSDDDWAYLESLGFTRHRGRRSADEQAALAIR